MIGSTKKQLTKPSLLAAIAMVAVISSFAQQPVINSADRFSAGSQDIITLQGSGFGDDATKLDVFFGASKGTVTLATDQLLEVAVPTGATYDKISVSHKTSGLTAYTSNNFLFSFGGEHGFGPEKLEGQKDFDAESGLYDLCLCDFDGDGRTDAATANEKSNLVTILANTTSAPGLASITFNKIPILLNANTVRATCGDLNGDGKPEIVLTEGGEIGDRIFIFRNTSAAAGSFTFNIQSIKLADKKLSRAQISDLDLNGKPELIVTYRKNEATSTDIVTVLENLSTPSTISFSNTLINIPVPGAVTSDGLDISDLNGDDLPDIVISQFLTSSSNLFILRNSSTPGNIVLGDITTLSVGNTVVNVKIGDLDNDQKPDIAVTQFLGLSISIFRNEGSGGTIAFSSALPIATEEKPWGLDFGDLDGDGKTDIVVGSVAKAITILNNESTPGNLSFQRSTKPTNFITRHVGIGDIDGDAKPDIAYTSVDDNLNGVPASKISVFRNTACLKPDVNPKGPHTICVGFPLKLTSNSSSSTTYEWKNSGTTVATGTDAFFDVTTTGDYTVTAISEGGSCSLTSNTVTVTVNPGTTTGTAIPVNNGPVCIGSTLTLSVNDVGATEYQWTGPEGYTGTGRTPPAISNFQQINAGRYNIDVIVGGCIAQQVSTVVDAVAVPDFQINMGSSGVVCPPDTKTLTLTPAPSTYTYQWFERTSGIITGATNAAYNTTATGEYYVQAKYTANPSCATVETSDAVVTFATPPTVGFTLPSTACMGENINFTNQSTTDPSVTASYLWEFGDGETSPDPEPVHQYLTASDFNVKLSVSYSNGACVTSLSKTIDIQNAPLATISNPDSKFSLCQGERLTLEVIGPFLSYKWSTNETTQSIEVNDEGIVAVEVTTSSGCVVSATREISLLETPVVTIQAEPAEIAEGQTSQLTASGLETYLWEPAETLSSATISNPVASPGTNTTYLVSGLGSNGCRGEASFELIVREGSVYGKLTPSKFFSPDNGDEYGKYWLVDRIEEYPHCTVSIYDDKGVKVHEAKPYLNNWDGTFKGRGLPDGVYYFVIKCEGDTNSPKTGSITILR